MRRSGLGVIALIMIALLSLTGCSPTVGEKWVAKVNGQAITLKDYNNRVDEVQKAFEKNLGKKLTDDQLKQVKTSVLQSMVGGELIDQQVKKLKLNINDSKVKDQLNNEMKLIGGEDKFKEFLMLQYLTTVADYKNQIALGEDVASDVKVTDSDAKAYFEAHPDQFKRPEQVKARHILVKTEEEAKDIIKQLDAKADFATLAKEKSIEPAAKDTGGELGYFSRGKMVPEFEEAAFSQKVGTYSKVPVKTEFGYHVILVEDHTKAVEPDFNRDKELAKNAALTDKVNAKLQTYVKDMYDKAKIEYAEGYKPES